MNIRQIARKIKLRETPFYDGLYRLIRAIQTVNVPIIRPIGRALCLERTLRTASWNWFIHNFYYIPLFKSQCASYGKNLKLVDGLPGICGDLTILIGDNCVLHGTSTLVGSKVFDKPTLRIGNNVHLGSNLGITVGPQVTIGDDVMIGNNVSIFSYEAHPADPAKRHGVTSAESGKPVVIGNNVMIGARSTIMKGVTIGENSIVSNSSFVIQKVPKDSLVMGNPARVYPLFY